MRFSRFIANPSSRFLLATVFVFLTFNLSVAQSTFDVEPPLQAETESADILTSPDPNALPTFAFVVASLNDDGRIEIKRSVPEQERLVMPGNAQTVGVPYTENVVQTFTVMVPYTEVVDGKPVTRMRAEKRTRTVPVTRIRRVKPDAKKPQEPDKQKPDDPDEKQPDPDKPVVKQVSVPYTVKIPFMVTVDGKQVTKYREETRMRTVSVVRGKTKTAAKVSTESYAVGKVKCYGVDGRPIDEAEIRKRLQEKTPVVLIKDPKAITPYFEVLLHPRAIFMVRPE